MIKKIEKRKKINEETAPDNKVKRRIFIILLFLISVGFPLLILLKREINNWWTYFTKPATYQFIYENKK